MAWRRGRAYGQDLPDRVLACPDLTLVEAAARFDVSPSYVSKVRARLRDQGDAAPGPQHNADTRSVCRWDRADIAEARVAWAALQPTLDPGRLVFLDETWAATNMAPTRGRAPRGERLVCAVPHGHWHTTTFLCGLRSTGPAANASRFGEVAPWVLDGAINGAAFLADVEQFLAPTLPPGDAVVLDHLSSHKVSGVREAVEACGATRLYPPPYSPDPNPIELACQTQAPAARRRQTHRRGTRADHRTPAQTVQPAGMRKLHTPPQLCTVRTIKV